MSKKYKIGITGGTGSFGSCAVTNYINDPDCTEVRVFSRDESKQFDLRQKFESSKLKTYIGDIRDTNGGLNEFTQGMDFLYHAAALKHVPTGEYFPLEMVKTNILGSENVFKAAIKNEVRSVVVLSTDKSVYPVNTMGMSKAIMEKIAMNYASQTSKTKFNITRYGNVIASRGSILPVFIDNILNNKPVKITDESMTRFLMSLDDSLDLVDYALKSELSSHLFVRKVPSAYIVDCIDALYNILGGKKKITKIGIRKGEKLHEVLCTNFELSNSKQIDNYLITDTLETKDYKDYFFEGNKKMTHPEDLRSDSKISLCTDLKDIENLFKNNSQLKELLNI